ncbi:hypothetical protein JZO70_16665 [Enterococcus sp. 669A]|uniref:ParB/Sulfiredoxin domain-containing protein n=1 Tax=Candidatus Enterococcus moelleringii TaxID=2815325 RepID=A0ABS3LDU5_9ENTE|nr:hypothetical protein [Enterococcus sp. 669A]MBO1307809.1 hypothetical protein [Enterococcus sp. 669A]
MEKVKTIQPLKEELRIKKLEEIKKHHKPEMTGVRLPYKGEYKEFNVYRIPLSCLVYNPYNGRIGTLVKTFEVKNRTLDPENIEDQKIIEDFLWKSKIDRNKTTMDSLLKQKQQQYGIVSRNGIIIDGNRRACLLNKLFREKDKYKQHDVSHCEYFNAVILDDNADQKEILELETTYQMGMDEKLDYNPIEKYLKTKQMLDIGHDEAAIARMMGENKSTIRKNLEILKLMNDYLDYHDYTGLYSLLEKREGQFVDLSSYEKAYRERSRNARTNWAYTDQDINDMLGISFDYIRAQYEGKEFRSIAQNSRGNVPVSFFNNKDVWKEFSDKHNEISNIEEESVDDYLGNNADQYDVTDILKQRDKEWTKEVSNLMKRNMGQSKRMLEDAQEVDQPLALLTKALKTLNTIDDESENFYTEEINKKVCELNTLVWKWKKSFDRRSEG